VLVPEESRSVDRDLNFGFNGAVVPVVGVCNGAWGGRRLVYPYALCALILLVDDGDGDVVAVDL
jgi:hypothetical protein